MLGFNSVLHCNGVFDALIDMWNFIDFVVSEELFHLYGYSRTKHQASIFLDVCSSRFVRFGPEPFVQSFEYVKIVI